MVNGCVWVTAETRNQKPENNSCFLVSRENRLKAVDWPWALFTITTNQKNTVTESPALTCQAATKRSLLLFFLYLPWPDWMNVSFEDCFYNNASTFLLKRCRILSTRHEWLTNWRRDSFVPVLMFRGLIISVSISKFKDGSTERKTH